MAYNFPRFPRQQKSHISNYVSRPKPYTSAIPTTYNPAETTSNMSSDGKYHLKLENLPGGWQETDVSLYLKILTDPVDKAYATDITGIQIKITPNLYNDNPSCFISFKTLQYRDQVYKIFKQDKTKFHGKKMFVRKVEDWTLQNEFNPSNQSNDMANATPSQLTSVVPRPTTSTANKMKPIEGKHILRLDNLPTNWQISDVWNYIGKHVNEVFAENIGVIRIKDAYDRSKYDTKSCYIPFFMRYHMIKAFHALKSTKTKIEGKKLRVNIVEAPDLIDMIQSPFENASNVPIQREYHLRISNVPLHWKLKDFSEYVKMHTDPADKAIAEDIISYKLSHAQLFNRGYMHFRTERFRDKAFELLSDTPKRVERKKLYTLKSTAPETWFLSSLDHDIDSSNDKVSPAPSPAVSGTLNTYKIPEKKVTEGEFYLRLSNVPPDWKWHEVLNYVKKHTDCVDKTITDDISCIQMKKGSSLLQGYLCFKTEHMREKAYKILEVAKEKINGKTLFAHKVDGPFERDRSRSPLHHDQSNDRVSPTPPLQHDNPSNDRDSPTPSHTSVTTDTAETPAPNVEYHIRLENVPCKWKWFEVMKYIKTNTDYVDRAIAADIAEIKITTILMPNFQEYHSTIVHFRRERFRDKALEVLQSITETFNGKKIIAHKLYKALTSNMAAPKDMSYMSDDEDGAYGLSMDLLKELNIDLPLSRKVFVQFLPLDCVESEAYNVFSCAGTIVSLSIQKKYGYLTAILEYEHPVEAVQAVSMFHEQEIFGRQINCHMLKYETDNNMVEGFSALGRGLGPNGAPLKDIRSTLEVKKLKADILAEYNTVLESSNELEGQIDSLIQENDMTLAIKIGQTNPNVTSHIAQLKNILAKSNTGMDSVPFDPLSNVDTQAQAENNQSGVIEPMELETNMQSDPNNIQVSPNQINRNTQGVSNMQSGPANMQNNFNTQNLNTQGGSNIQSGQNNTQKCSFNMQSGPANMQTNPNTQNVNTQSVSNMQSASNLQSGQNNFQKVPCNMQSGPAYMQNLHTQGGSNMQSASNLQSGQNNTQKGPSNMQSGPAYMQMNSNAQNLNTQGGSNMESASNIQSVQYNTQKGPSNMQSGPAYMQNVHTQGGSNMQSASNLQSGQNNTQKGPSNMQSGPAYMQMNSNAQNFNTQGGSNMESASNIQSVQYNTQKGPSNMQSGPAYLQMNANAQNLNTQGGSNMQNASNIQNVQYNTQKGPNNMQSGPAYMQKNFNTQNLNTQGVANMQSAPNIQSGQTNNLKGPLNMQSGPVNMQNLHTQGGLNMHSASNLQSGQNNNQMGPFNMQSGPAYMQNLHTQGVSNMQSAFNMQSGQNTTQNIPYNMQSGPANMQIYNTLPSSGTGTFCPIPTVSQLRVGHPKPITNTYKQNPQQNPGMVVQFRNLPPSLTQAALKAKVDSIGTVMFVQLDSGQALVYFLNADDADRCFRLFNLTQLDGKLIEVRKL